MKYKASKLDKVKQIICALHNLPDLPPDDHWRVKQLMRQPLKILNGQFEIAKKILQNRK